MAATFRAAYKRMREFHIFDCFKYDLHPDPEKFADEKINELSTVELLNELERFAEIVDDEVQEHHLQALERGRGY